MSAAVRQGKDFCVYCILFGLIKLKKRCGYERKRILGLGSMLMVAVMFTLFGTSRWGRTRGEGADSSNLN